MRTKYVTSGALIVGMMMASPLVAQEHEHEHGQEAAGHSHAQAESHGGVVTMTKEFHFEVAFHRDEVTVFAYDSKQAPIDPRLVTGTVRIDFRDKERKPLTATLKYVAPTEHEHAEEEDGHGHDEDGHGGQGHEEEHEHGSHGGDPVGFLTATIDLAKILEEDAKATISLSKLPGKSETKVEFKETFRLARLTEYVCPMKCIKPLTEAGDCPKCDMDLVPVKYVYACPMHSKVTAHEGGGKCWLCGMELVKATDAPEGSTEHDKEEHDGHSDHDH